MYQAFGQAQMPAPGQAMPQQQQQPQFGAPQQPQDFSGNQGGRGGGRGRGGRGRGGGRVHGEGGPPGGGRGGGAPGGRVCWNAEKPGGCFKADCTFSHPPGTHNPKGGHATQPNPHMGQPFPGQASYQQPQTPNMGQMPGQQQPGSFPPGAPSQNSTPSQGRRPCKFGANCNKFRQGTCTWDHSAQTGGGQQQPPQQQPGMAGQGQQQFGAGQQQPQGSSGCDKFRDGYCGMVKCKFQHIFSSQQKKFKLNTTLNPLGAAQLTTASLINQGSQLMACNANGQVSLIDLPALSVSMQFALQGNVTASFCSDQLPNNLFFGMQDFSLKLVIQGGEINQANAHNAAIKAIEFTQYNGQEVVFTAGMDNCLKAWMINRATSQFTPVDNKDLGSPIHCLQMLPNNVIIAGLDNGQMSVWNLNDNTVNSMPAHPCPITAMFRHNQFLISGDVQGNIQVRDSGTAAVILQSPAPRQQQKKASPISSLTLLDGTMPIIVGADYEGQLTFLTMEPNAQTGATEAFQASQGGHNDKKQPILKVFVIASLAAPVTVDPSGNFRLWKE